MGARGVLRIIEGGSLGFWCPGCKQMHVVSSGWTFSGDYDRPTFSPSVLVTGRDFTSAGRAAYEAWCAAGHSPPGPQFESADTRCHSFVRDGRIEFLSDCTHALAGQTMPLEPRPY
jgi:hypothetical protein